MTFSREMPVILTGGFSVDFTMTSDIPIEKSAMMAHLSISGNASNGPGNEDFVISDWLEQNNEIFASASAGTVHVEPTDEWGRTTFKVTLNNSYMSARINDIVWND